MGRYDETKVEIDGDTERVRSLVSEGKEEAAGKLMAEVGKLIDSLPKNQQKRYREALEAAGKPPVVHTPTPLTPVDWRSIDGALDAVEAGAEAFAEGVRYQMKGAKHGKEMAKKSLDTRLLIRNRDLPDLLCWSQEARDAQSEMYNRAGAKVKGPDGERLEALDLAIYSARNQMGNVLPLFIRSLDEDTETAKKYFGEVLERFPDLSPTEAVYRAYDDAEMSLPRYTASERRSMRDRLKKARAISDDDSVAELEEALGLQSKQDPEETLSTSLDKLHKSLNKAEKLLPAIPDFPEDRKAEIRDEAKSLRDTAEKIIEATMPR